MIWCVRVLIAAALITVFSLSATSQNRAIVTKKSADLRSNPNTAGAVVTTLSKGEKIDIVAGKERENWLFVSRDDFDGWIKKSSVERIIGEPTTNSIWLFIGRSNAGEGFGVAFYLDVTELIRDGDRVRFWTKAVPDKTENYASQFLATTKKVHLRNFAFNMDLWNGDCSDRKMYASKSLIRWKNRKTTAHPVEGIELDASSGTAAGELLREACKVGEKL